MNQRIYNGKGADILIPDKHIAIEANGCYWHSEIFVDKLYHQDKKKLIEATGDSLISIWEDDWNNEIKKSIIISRLKSKLGLIPNKIGARKTVIKEISGRDSREFLDKNHLQGYANASINIGLFYVLAAGKPTSLDVG